MVSPAVAKGMQAAAFLTSCTFRGMLGYEIAYDFAEGGGMSCLGEKVTRYGLSSG
jgi:hypothetical protein